MIFIQYLHRFREQRHFYIHTPQKATTSEKSCGIEIASYICFETILIFSFVLRLTNTHLSNGARPFRAFVHLRNFRRKCISRISRDRGIEAWASSENERIKKNHKKAYVKQRRTRTRYFWNVQIFRVRCAWYFPQDDVY